MKDVAQQLAEMLEAKLLDALLGGRPQDRRQTLLRLRHGLLEAVELDDAGSVIEPLAQCCRGVVLHAADCKAWSTS